MLLSDGRGVEDAAEFPVLSEGVILELVLLGGRGTLRFDATCEGSVLAVPPAEGGRGTLRAEVPPVALRADNPPLKLDGGRGTERPAGPGMPRFAEASGVRPVEVSGPRAVALPVLRAAVSPPRADEVREPAGGVRWLTVGRENADEDGRAAVSPVRPPSMA